MRARAPDGTVHELAASLVVDASGRDTFVAARFGLRGPHPELQKACVWTHFTGVAREAGRAAGNIRIAARPKNLFRARDAITSLLAGDVMPRLTDRLRRSVFWLGVRRTRARMAHAGQDVRPRVRD